MLENECPVCDYANLNDCVSAQDSISAPVAIVLRVFLRSGYTWPARVAPAASFPEGRSDARNLHSIPSRMPLISILRGRAEHLRMNPCQIRVILHRFRAVSL
jgi:hypothetical protein